MSKHTDKNYDIQEPQRCFYIYNRISGRFELDVTQSDNAMEFKLADYAIKHILGDFEDNSCIWYESKVGGTVFLAVFSLLLACAGTYFLDKTHMFLGAFGLIFGLILNFQSLKLLTRKRESGDDKAASYYWKIKEVYNIKLFYHNLRVEMFYQDGQNAQKAQKSVQYSQKEFKENKDLVFEFSTIDNKKSNIENWRLCQSCRQDIVIKRNKSKSRMKNSFLTADTGIETGSEKISPEGDERAQKKGLLDGLMSRSKSGGNSKKRLESLEQSNSLKSNFSEYESDANLISSRREMNLSIVDEENSPGDKRNSDIEYLPTTQRGLINSDGEDYLDYKVDCELGVGGSKQNSKGSNVLKESTRTDKIRQKRQKNKDSYSDNLRELGKGLKEEQSCKINDKENRKPPTQIKGPSMNIHRIQSPEKRQKIEFQSFKEHNTPKLPSIKKRQRSDTYNSGTKRLESSTFSREERLVSLKDSSIFLQQKKTNEFSFYNNKHDSELMKKAKFQLSNKKPRLNFDDIPVSPSRENKPQSPVKNEIFASSSNNNTEGVMVRQLRFDTEDEHE